MRCRRVLIFMVVAVLASIHCARPQIIEASSEAEPAINLSQWRMLIWRKKQKRWFSIPIRPSVTTVGKDGSVRIRNTLESHTHVNLVCTTPFLTSDFTIRARLTAGTAIGIFQRDGHDKWIKSKSPAKASPYVIELGRSGRSVTSHADGVPINPRFHNAQPNLIGMACITLNKGASVTIHEFSILTKATSSTSGKNALLASSWHMRCYVAGQKKWIGFPLEKATAKTEPGLLTVTNTTGVHTFANLTNRALLQGDFQLRFQSKGGANFAIADPGPGGGKAIIVKLPADNRWHKTTFVRKGTSLSVTIDEKPVSARLFKAQPTIAGHFLISILSNKSVSIKDFHVTR